MVYVRYPGSVGGDGRSVFFKHLLWQRATFPGCPRGGGHDGPRGQIIGFYLPGQILFKPIKRKEIPMAKKKDKKKGKKKSKKK